jgi:hypothetical protein
VGPGRAEASRASQPYRAPCTAAEGRGREVSGKPWARKALGPVSGKPWAAAGVRHTCSVPAACGRAWATRCLVSLGHPACGQWVSEPRAVAQVPEEFLDPLLGTLMTDPVILPSSQQVEGGQRV